MGHLRNPDLPQAASENELVVPEQLIARAYTRLGPLRRPRTDDRVPEQRTKKSNYNNAEDEASRVGTKDLVVRGGQPVGIAHAKLLGRPPAEPTSPDIDKDFLNLS